MAGAESHSTNPFYSAGELPNLPHQGPFTTADQYGNRINPKSLQNGGVGTVSLSHKPAMKRNRKSLQMLRDRRRSMRRHASMKKKQRQAMRQNKRKTQQKHRRTLRKTASGSKTRRKNKRK